MFEAKLYKKIINGVQCSACAQGCKISDGQKGICGVRQNIGGKLFLLTYGQVAAANVDPMEKKPLYHFLPGAKIFSLGTLGCNFACQFCQNFDISQISRNAPEVDLEKSGQAISPEEVSLFVKSHHLPAIAFTYNEPAIFAEYAAAVMKIVKSRGVKGVFVSNGYETSETLDFLEPYIDAYNIDLKSFSEKFYQKTCKAKLAPVLQTIEEIHRRGKWLEITTLLVSGENDGEKEITAIAEFIKKISPDIPWHISAFYPAFQMQDRSATTKNILDKAFAAGKKAGLNYVYTGNIDDKEKSQTVCPKCKEILVERSGFSVLENKIQDSACFKCGEKIAGVWQ